MNKGKKTKQGRAEYKINVDLAMEKYNSINDEPISQNKFCKKFKITAATIISYRKNKSPDAIRFVSEIMEETGLTFEELVSKK